MADSLALGASASGEGYERLRRALESVEASNDPGAVQRVTNAVGLYQFIPRYWEGFAQEQTGRSLKSFLPKDNSPQELARAAKDQRDILFPKYYEKEMAPWIAKMRKDGLGSGRSDIDLAIMFHKLGDAAAKDFLKSGRDASKGTADNTPIEQYIHAVASKARSKSLASDATAKASRWHQTQDTFVERPVHHKSGQQVAHHRTMPAAGATPVAQKDIQTHDNAWVLSELKKLTVTFREGTFKEGALEMILQEGHGRGVS
jgi:hypothetical protein